MPRGRLTVAMELAPAATKSRGDTFVMGKLLAAAFSAVLAAGLFVGTAVALPPTEPNGKHGATEVEGVVYTYGGCVSNVAAFPDGEVACWRFFPPPPGPGQQ